MTRPAVSRHCACCATRAWCASARATMDGSGSIEITPGPLRDVARWAEQYEVFWQDGLARLKQHVERGARRGREERG